MSSAALLVLAISALNVGDNLIGEDDQKGKLELVVETARQVWASLRLAAPDARPVKKEETWQTP